jgi:hypothetical protein
MENNVETITKLLTRAIKKEFDEKVIMALLNWNFDKF